MEGTTTMSTPKTLQEAIVYFSDADTSLIASGVAWYFKGPNAGLIVAGVGLAIVIAVH